MQDRKRSGERMKGSAPASEQKCNHRFQPVDLVTSVLRAREERKKSAVSSTESSMRQSFGCKGRRRCRAEKRSCTRLEKEDMVAVVARSSSA